MFSEDNWEDDFQIELLTARFEKMIEEGSPVYFDAEEFEVLIDYYQDEYDDENAALALEYALTLFPDNNNLLIKKARQYAVESDFDKAMNLLQSIEKSQHDNPDFYFARGNVFFMMSEYKRAISEYKKAADLLEVFECEEVYYVLSCSYENMGDYEHALFYLKKALALSKEIEVQYEDAFYFFERTNMLVEGCEFFEEATNKYPYNKQVWSFLGQLYAERLMFDEAIDKFDFAIAIDEKDKNLYYHKAFVYEHQNRYREAIGVYNDMIDLNIDRAQGYACIGKCFIKMNDPLNALTFFKKAIKADGTLPDPWIGIALIFRKDDKLTEAIKYVEHALHLSPSDWDSNLLLTRLYLQTDRIDDAEKHFEKMMKESDKPEEFFIEYIEFFLQQNDYTEAFDRCVLAVENFPDSAPLLYYAAGICFLMKNDTSAFLALEKALLLDYFGYESFLERFLSLFPAKEIEIMSFIREKEIKDIL
ncbi:MAG: tetratricopeptide repeat protein [Lentimicrobiaceae bacterium]|jgi:tetratricopeptide (TPR) repeat protein|nr:tetratricopeptide repeat protein [Lentimicrobiaceae bacterium]